MMQFRSKALAGGDVLALDRRVFIGSLAMGAGAAATGGFASVAAAATAQPTAAVFMDMPFVDRSGTHPAYRPPVASYAAVELNPEHHFFV